MLTNRSSPDATVIPVLVYPDVRAVVAWLGAGFGFVERARIGESHRSQMQLGTSGGVIVADARGEQQAHDPPDLAFARGDLGDGTITIDLRPPPVDLADRP